VPETVSGDWSPLYEHGLRVPDDVSVVGYDDIPEAEFFTPSLTTVRQPFTDVGERAIAALLTGLAGGGTGPVVSVVDPTLVVRTSTTAYAG
jgi:LacI family transcriptional regulator